MKSSSVLRRFTSCLLVILIGVPSLLSAQTHLVSPAELQREMMAASAVRQRNVEAITGLFSSTPQAQKALSAAGVDVAQVKIAVSSLSDPELARLAARAEVAKADLAAGRLSDRDLLVVLLGIAALILIIVAVR